MRCHRLQEDEVPAGTGHDVSELQIWWPSTGVADGTQPVSQD